MKKIYIACPKFIYKNEIFNLESVHNWDNAFYPYYLLKEKLKEKNIEINTFDYFNENNNDDYALLFFDFPRNMDYFSEKHGKIKKFLFAYESPIKNPENLKKENFHYFDKIFTWDTRFVDNQKCFYSGYSRKIPKTLEINHESKNKLLTAICGHKLQTHELELYSERIKAIRWFEKNRPEDFDLYGDGWDQHYFKDKLSRLNKLKFLKKILKPSFPSYRGFVKDKKDVYKKYRFALCYENAEFPDYITEKIFDCFLGGIVPIYLGAPNIRNFIPQDTFVDKRKFNNYESLYANIKNMPEKQYADYLSAIKNFVEGEKIYPFSAECFANILSREISKSIS